MLTVVIHEPSPLHEHEPPPLHIRRLKSQHQGTHRRIHHHFLSSPLMALPRGEMLPPLLSLRGLPPPPQGSCSSSLLTPLMKFGSPPLPRTSFAPQLGFCTVGISLTSSSVGVQPSKPFATSLSTSITWPCRRTLRLVTSASRLCFACGNASAMVTLVGRLKRFNHLPLPILPPLLSWSSSHCSVTATPFPLSPPS